MALFVEGPVGEKNTLQLLREPRCSSDFPFQETHGASFSAPERKASPSSQPSSPAQSHKSRPQPCSLSRGSLSGSGHRRRQLTRTVPPCGQRQQGPSCSREVGVGLAVEQGFRCDLGPSVQAEQAVRPCTSWPVISQQTLLLSEFFYPVLLVRCPLAWKDALG